MRAKPYFLPLPRLLVGPLAVEDTSSSESSESDISSPSLSESAISARLTAAIFFINAGASLTVGLAAGTKSAGSVPLVPLLLVLLRAYGRQTTVSIHPKSSAVGM